MCDEIRRGGVQRESTKDYRITAEKQRRREKGRKKKHGESGWR